MEEMIETESRLNTWINSGFRCLIWLLEVQSSRRPGANTTNTYLNAIQTVQANCWNFSLNTCYKAKSQEDLKEFQLQVFICSWWASEKSSHLIWAFFRFHRIGVEQPDDCALVCLPVLFVDITEQEERDTLIEIPQVVQPPDAEGSALEQTFAFLSAISKGTLSASSPAVAFKELVLFLPLRFPDLEKHNL